MWLEERNLLLLEGSYSESWTAIAKLLKKFWHNIRTQVDDSSFYLNKGKKLLCDHVWSLIHSTDDVGKKTPPSGVDKSLFHNRRTQLPNPTSVGQWLVLLHSPSPPCPWKQTSLLPRLKSMDSCVSCTFSQQSKSLKLCESIMVSLRHQQHVGFPRHGVCCNNSVFQFYGLWGNGKLSFWT